MSSICKQQNRITKNRCKREGTVNQGFRGNVEGRMMEDGKWKMEVAVFSWQLSD